MTSPPNLEDEITASLVELRSTLADKATRSVAGGASRMVLARSGEMSPAHAVLEKNTSTVVWHKHRLTTNAPLNQAARVAITRTRASRSLFTSSSLVPSPQ